MSSFPPAQKSGVAGVTGVAGVQEHPTGKACEDLRSNWRSADFAVAEKGNAKRQGQVNGVGRAAPRVEFHHLKEESTPGIGERPQLLNSCNSCNS
jgi:hypothetical protein